MRGKETGRETEMEERRRIGRVGYQANAVMVACDTQEKFFVHTQNASPMGMAVHMDADAPELVGKDVILVTDTFIMYADVKRQEKREDGSWIAGISARKFTEDVLQYLYDRIAPEEEG